MKITLTLALAGLGGALAVAQAPPVVTNALPPAAIETNAISEVRPAQIHLSPPLAEVVRLSQAGTDESVILAYIQQLPAVRLSAGEIIYLQDLGITDAVLKALVSRSPVTAGAPATLPATNAVASTNAAVPDAPEPQPVAAPVSAPTTVTEFYDPLTRYGTWVDITPYGWCWQPSVVVINPGWRPYCDNGYWLWSDCGWYWHSHYSWGWAPFHYGRWYYHPHRRWVWAPDPVWGPSWVSWRYGADYCGWAPLPPGAHFSAGMGWTYGGSSVGTDCAFGLSASHYTFVSAAHVADRKLAARALPQSHANVAFNHTTVVNNYAIRGTRPILNRGVDRSRIEAAAHTKIPEVSVRELPRGSPHRTLPDRVTKVGKADVVYRPAPKLEAARQPAPEVETVPLPTTDSTTMSAPGRPLPKRATSVRAREPAQPLAPPQPKAPPADTPSAPVNSKVAPAPSQPRVAPGEPSPGKESPRSKPLVRSKD